MRDLALNLPLAVLRSGAGVTVRDTSGRSARALVARSTPRQTCGRASMRALALGFTGRPRFEQRTGPFGITAAACHVAGGTSRLAGRSQESREIDVRR
jgi:hypothetical protein